MQTQAQLSLAELDAAAGEVHAYEAGLRRALERLEPAAARWPTSVELNVRLAAALVALAEVVERKPGGEPEARALGERAVSELEPLEKAGRLGGRRLRDILERVQATGRQR